MTTQPVQGHVPGLEDVDWDALERSPEYRELAAEKRSFVIPATVGYLTAYFGFLIVAGVAPDLMGRRLHGGITVGYALMAALFVLVWALVFAYGRLANRRWDSRAERVIELATGADAPGDAGGRRTGPRTAPSGRQGVTS